MTFDLHAIAAGHNGTPVPWTEIETDLGNFFDPIETTGTYSEGELVMRGDGSLSVMGMESIEGIWDFLEFQEFLRFLRDTYCDGGYSGLVTIDVSTEEDDVLYRYNGTMHLPTIDQVERDRETGWYKGARIRFIDLEFLEEVA